MFLWGQMSAECGRRIRHLIEIAKRIGWQLTVVVFERGVCLSLVSARQITLVVGFIAI